MGSQIDEESEDVTHNKPSFSPLWGESNLFSKIVKWILPTRGRIRAYATCLICILNYTPSHASDPKFVSYIQQKIWPQARAQGISESTFRAAFDGIITPDRTIITSAKGQPEFASTIGNYVTKRVSAARIQNGLQKLDDERVYNALSRIGRTYNVDPYVVLAIWGLESSYGAALNPSSLKNVFRSMATLAYADPKRAQFGMENTIAALKIVQRGYAEVSEMRGSWAGAMGHTQFIPTSYLTYAQDFDGDGHRDIWNNIGDALATCAAHLSMNGGINAPIWIDEQPWGVEVKLPQNFNFDAAFENGVWAQRGLREWQNMGIVGVAGNLPATQGDVTLYIPSGANGPVFLLYPNFQVIKRYNNSNAYALSVGMLADRLRGERIPQRAWPSDDAQLTRTNDIKTLQTRLKQMGLYNDKLDGFIGPRVYSAVHGFQKKAGISPADGLPTQVVLDASMRR